MKDEVYVENKAYEVYDLVKKEGWEMSSVVKFIRVIIEDCQLKVNQEFMKKWNDIFDGGHGYKTKWEALEAMLKDAGVIVIK